MTYVPMHKLILIYFRTKNKNRNKLILDIRILSLYLKLKHLFVISLMKLPISSGVGFPGGIIRSNVLNSPKS